MGYYHIPDLKWTNKDEEESTEFLHGDVANPRQGAAITPSTQQSPGHVFQRPPLRHSSSRKEVNGAQSAPRSLAEEYFKLVEEKVTHRMQGSWTRE